MCGRAGFGVIDGNLNSISLPPELGLWRDFRRPIPPEHAAQYAAGALGQYDTDTVFYDVFVTADCRRIIALAPPMYNLERVLLPAVLQVGRRLFALKLWARHKKLWIFSAGVGKTFAEVTPIPAELRFANGLTASITLHKPTPVSGSAVVTLQKDNKIRWLIDWAAHYRQKCGVDHVVIYDNGSANEDEAAKALRELATVIPWPFPYGVFLRGSNKFAQAGALNHFKFRYARDALIFNFDIDELLVLRSAKVRQVMARNRATRFVGFRVPHYTEKKENYSYADFPVEAAVPQDRGTKYVAHGRSCDLMSVHHMDALPKYGRRFLPKRFLRGRVMPPCDAYFLHYAGITVNWQGSRLPESKIDLGKPVKISAQRRAKLARRAKRKKKIIAALTAMIALAVIAAVWRGLGGR